MKQFLLVGFHPVTHDNFGGSQDDSSVHTYMSPVLKINGFNYIPSRPDWKLEDLKLFSEKPRYEISERIMVNEGDSVSFAGKTFINDAVFITATAGLDVGFALPASNGWNEMEKGLWQVEPYLDFVANVVSLSTALDSWAGSHFSSGVASERFAFQAWGLMVRMFAPWNHEIMERKIELLDLLGQYRDAQLLRESNR